MDGIPAAPAKVLALQASEVILDEETQPETTVLRVTTILPASVVDAIRAALREPAPQVWIRLLVRE
jgi:hypothetical protein